MIRKLIVTRQACCAADDQAMPLELVLHVVDVETFGAVMQRIAQSRFLQFSSSRTCTTGYVGGVPVVRMQATFASGPEVECIASVNRPVRDVIPDGLLEFSWHDSHT